MMDYKDQVLWDIGIGKHHRIEKVYRSSNTTKLKLLDSLLQENNYVLNVGILRLCAKFMELLLDEAAFRWWLLWQVQN